jgi:hypothetical protein
MEPSLKKLNASRHGGAALVGQGIGNYLTGTFTKDGKKDATGKLTAECRAEPLALPAAPT